MDYVRGMRVPSEGIMGSPSDAFSNSYSVSDAVTFTVTFTLAITHA